MKLKFTDKEVVVAVDEITGKKTYDSWTENYKSEEEMTEEIKGDKSIEFELISYECSECKEEIPTKDMKEAKVGMCQKCKDKV